MKITYNDIQKIEDGNTLIEFLKEKLNLPIPDDKSLENITSILSNYALGLTGFDSEQVLECRELSVSPGKPSDIFLIRFKDEYGYPKVLHAVTKGLHKRGLNPTDLRFICTTEDFQLFALAYFKDSVTEEKQSSALNIYTWAQDNTEINIAPKHEVPDSLFSDKFSEIFQDTDATSKLLRKIENIGSPLIEHAKMYSGPSIRPGCQKALVLDKDEREKLIQADAKIEKLIIPVVRMPRKSRWKPNWQYVIWISSSEHVRWPWSDANSEEEAERIFSCTYPAISQHIFKHKSKLIDAAPSGKGKFYWELPLNQETQTFYSSKILYPADGFSLDAAYDKTGSFILKNWTCYIPTTDLSLLAILNSKLFGIYAKNNYQAKHAYKSEVPENWLTFKKANMKNFPMADRTTEQKADLVSLVEQILKNVNGPHVRDREQEINQLVYNLYELTPAEIKLIEEETNK